jgi:hypothetical protein
MTIPEEETTQSEAMSQDDLELARRLAATCIAHHSGYKSIDYARKTYVDSSPEPIGAEWIELARIVKARMYRMMQGIGDIPPITNRTQ